MTSFLIPSLPTAKHSKYLFISVTESLQQNLYSVTYTSKKWCGREGDKKGVSLDALKSHQNGMRLMYKDFSVIGIPYYCF